MRPVTQRLSAAGFSPWVVLDRYVRGFTVGLGVNLSSNANLTYSVQHTFDNVLVEEVLSTPITRVTTTATLTKTNHGLSVGDFIQIAGGGAPFDGQFSVATVPNQNTVTYTVLNSGAASSSPDARAVLARVMNHDILNGKTASDDGNYIAPPVACRFIITTFSAGYADLTVVQGGH